MGSSRLHYREHQLLGHEELQDEQAYRIRIRRRHNIAHHGWGIVQGLVLQATRGGVKLSPGFAVDGYGRELIVPSALNLRQQVFVEEVLNGHETGYADVWLTYRIVALEGTGPRCYEDAWVGLACAGLGGIAPDPVDPRRPPEVPGPDLDFGPGLEPPDDPRQEWPVYLGRVAVGHGDPKTPYSINAIEPVELAYAGLVGAGIQAPWSSDVWMQIGDQEASVGRRFAVRLADDAGVPVDRLSLDRQGGIDLRGRLKVSAAGAGAPGRDGHLAIVGPVEAGVSGPGVELSTKPEPELAAPWQLYRTRLGEGTAAIEQLRIETLNPGDEGDPARHEVVFRDLGRTGQSAVLTVRSDGKVIIDGDLVIEGQLVEGAIPADIEDERFRDELVSRYTKGLTLAGNEVDAYYKLDIDIATPTVTTAGVIRQIEVRITLANKNSGLNAREVYLSSIEFEVRDADQKIVNLESVPVPTPNPIPPAGTSDVNVGFQTNLSGVYTLIARVRTVGGSQSILEQSSSRVVSVT